VQYWRKLRLLATSYTPSEGGKAPDDPDYGITRIGLKAGRGIVAVDPRVINLRSTVYVPGYGLGFAGDTGGRIKGRHIDLGYPEGSPDLWYRWVDVYVLTPVPPVSQINWTLLDYPNEKDNPGER
jgi:3D (Asp-Asp-Asp) domain-containing protein